MFFKKDKDFYDELEGFNLNDEKDFYRLLQAERVFLEKQKKSIKIEQYASILMLLMVCLSFCISVVQKNWLGVSLSVVGVLACIFTMKINFEMIAMTYESCGRNMVMVMDLEKMLERLENE